MKTKRFLCLVLVIFAMTLFITACATRGICSFCDERKIIVDEDQFLGATLRICQDCVNEIEAYRRGSRERREDAINDLIQQFAVGSDIQAQEYNEVAYDKPELTRITSAELFADIHVEYEGVSPSARAVIRNASNHEFIRNIIFRADNGTNLANGNTFTVRADIRPEQAERSGYFIEDFEKTFVVEGVDEYISSFSIIDNETFESMDKFARDVIESAIARRGGQDGNFGWIRQYLYPDTSSLGVGWNLEYDIIELNLVNVYFLSLKDGIQTGFNTSYNLVYLVYELKFTTRFTDGGNFDVVYFPIEFRDIVLRSTGIVDVERPSTSIPRGRSNHLDNVYRDFVTANRARYDIEVISF